MGTEVLRLLRIIIFKFVILTKTNSEKISKCLKLICNSSTELKIIDNIYNLILSVVVLKLQSKVI